MPSSGSEVLNGFAELFDKPLLNVRPFLGLNKSGQYIFHAISESPNLSIGDCPEPAATLSEEERIARNITGRMPRSLKEAREKLRGSATAKEIFGETFVDKYLSVNEVRRSLRTSV